MRTIIVGFIAGFVGYFFGGAAQKRYNDEHLLPVFKESAFEKAKLVETTIETDGGYRSYRTDTLFIMPISAAKSFHGAITPYIKSGKLKVEKSAYQPNVNP